MLCLCGLDPLIMEKPLVVCNQAQSSSLPNAARFGLFDERFYSNYPAGIDSLTLLLGTRPGFVLWFMQIDDPFPTAKVSGNSALGIKTVISMNIRSLKIEQGRNDTLLGEIAAGLWDKTLSGFAILAASVSAPVYLRFGYEMNGGWFSWGKQPAAFVAAWNRARGIFKLAGATNVMWIFAPGVLSGTMSFEHDISPYYPGDSAVDIAGLDGYNFGDFTDKWNWRHRWQSFRMVFERSLVAVTSFGKPVWITETGCPSDPRRPEWLRELFLFMDNNPCIETMLWFNGHKAEEPDFRIESDSASVRVFREWLQM